MDLSDDAEQIQRWISSLPISTSTLKIVIFGEESSLKTRPQTIISFCFSFSSLFLEMTKIYFPNEIARAEMIYLVAFCFSLVCLFFISFLFGERKSNTIIARTYTLLFTWFSNQFFFFKPTSQFVQWIWEIWFNWDNLTSDSVK